MRYLLSAFIIFAWSGLAQAATLYMDPNTASLNRGDAVKIAVRLDTDEAAGECINAVDAVITYSDSIVPDDISIGKSIFPIWAQYPVIDKEKKTISFAGGIPNGYCGRVQGDPNLTNTLVELFFRAPGLQVGGGEERTAASIQFSDDTTAYINDGLGTKADLQKFGSTFTLSDSVGQEIIDPWSGDVQADDIRPEEFSISIERDEKTFGGKYYIVFNTTDKQTGVSHYEVMEESVKQSNLFDFGAATAPWVQTRSPYVLKDQTLNSIIRVRAIDKAGNEYLATLQAEESMRQNKWPLEIMLLIGGGVAMLAVITLITFIFLRRRRQQSKTETEELTEKL